MIIMEGVDDVEIVNLVLRANSELVRLSRVPLDGKKRLGIARRIDAEQDAAAAKVVNTANA